MNQLPKDIVSPAYALRNAADCLIAHADNDCPLSAGELRNLAAMLEEVASRCAQSGAAKQTVAQIRAGCVADNVISFPAGGSNGLL